MTSPEIEKAFNQAWCQETQSSPLAPSVLHRSLHASGYRAGAEAKAESMTKTERDRWMPAMERFGKGERVKVLEDVKRILRRYADPSDLGGCYGDPNQIDEILGDVNRLEKGAE